MTEVEQLQAQIEELKKTVDDLKSGCLKVETDRQKLSRLRRKSVIQSYRKKHVYALVETDMVIQGLFRI